MPGPGTGPQPGGWETLLYQKTHNVAEILRTKLWIMVIHSLSLSLSLSLSHPHLLPVLLIQQVHATSVHCVCSGLSSAEKFTHSLNLGGEKIMYFWHPSLRIISTKKI